jgi:hypothetical protein
MNCCNDAGRCTNGRHGTPCAARSATRINTRTDAPATGMHFAPGAIEHHVRPVFGNPAQRRELGRWLRLLGVASALCIAVAFGSGYIAARFFGA